MSFSIRPPMTAIGPIHVRMTGTVRGDEKGPGVGIVNAPTAAEATAELHRVARVSGADKVVSVASDYRRAALAGGTTSTQWRIEVQAWGTAMAPAKVDPAEAAEREKAEMAGRTRGDAEKTAKDGAPRPTDSITPDRAIADDTARATPTVSASELAAAPVAADTSSAAPVDDAVSTLPIQDL